MAFGLVENITEFSDDILLFIFSHLSSWDLLNVLDTCDRFNKIGRDHSLWRKADFSDGNLTAGQITRRVLHCLQSCTKVLNFRGQKKKCGHKRRWKTDLLSPSLMKSIGKKCPSLIELYLNEAVVDAKKFKLTNFGEVPELKILSIVDCEFINLPSPVTDGSYFRNMSAILPKLESLEISKCNWINDYDLMVLSKLDSLKRLILKSDLRIGFTMVYLSLSFRFGFKNLEELDLRGTSLQNNDMQSVVQSGKLKSLSVGPIGCVKRLSDEYDGRFSLVMSDPQRRDEPKQQVVVINMGPNGPHWRQANDDELDEMGLHWLRNGINQSTQTCDKEEHYFFGKEGKLLGKSDFSEGECSKTLDEIKKRKRDECADESDNDGDEHNCKHKKSNEAHDDCDYTSSSDEEDNTETPPYKSPKIEEGNLPDECLSDFMVHAFKDHSSKLNHLSLSGCAISNAGVIELVKYTPLLRHLDVSNTLVTTKGLQQAQLILPECIMIGDVYTSSR